MADDARSIGDSGSARRQGRTEGSGSPRQGGVERRERPKPRRRRSPRRSTPCRTGFTRKADAHSSSSFRAPIRPARTARSAESSTPPDLSASVTPFKRPSEDELAHDYLRRVHLASPRRGTIGIFNRSHYEDVLVVKVRGLAPTDEIERRYEQINAFERILAENGTRILKFMLHISKKEQAERLQERLDDPDKNWKFNPWRPGGPRALGRLRGSLRDGAAPLLDGMGALARRAGRPQMGAQCW